MRLLSPVLLALWLFGSITISAQDILQRTIDIADGRMDVSAVHAVDLGDDRYLLAVQRPGGSEPARMQLTPWTSAGVGTSRLYPIDYRVEVNGITSGGTTALIAASAQRYNDSLRGLVVRADRSGAVVWARSVAATLRHTGSSAITTSGDDVIVAGAGTYYVGNEERVDLVVTRLSADGTTIWSRMYGGDRNETPSAIAAADGGFYVAGNLPTTSSAQGFLARIDDSGELRWVVGLTTSADALTMHPEGGVVVGGMLGSRVDGDFHFRATLAHIDTGGAIRWARSFGTDRYTAVRGLVLDASDRIVALTDMRPGASGPSDVGIAIYGDDGTMLALRRRVTEGSQVPTSIRRSGARLLVTAIDVHPAINNTIALVLRSDVEGSFGCDETELATRGEELALTAEPFEAPRLADPLVRAAQLDVTDTSSFHADHCSVKPERPSRRLRSITLLDPNNRVSGVRHLLQNGAGLDLVASTTLSALGIGTGLYHVDSARAAGSVLLQAASGALEVSDVERTPSGGTLVAGRLNVQTRPVWFVTSYDSSGIPQWSRQIDRVMSTPELVLIPDGGVVVMGRRMDTLGRQPDRGYSLLALDSSGRLEWSRRVYDSIYNGVDAALAVDGGFVIAGESASAGATAVYVARFDREGRLLRSRRYRLPEYSRARVVALTGEDDGSMTIAGDVMMGNGTGDPFLMRLAADESVLWTRSYGALYEAELVTSVARTWRGEHLFGIQVIASGGSGPKIVAVDREGRVRWSRTYTASVERTWIKGIEAVAEMRGGDLVALTGVSDHAQALLHLAPTGEAACSSSVVPVSPIEIATVAEATTETANILDATVPAIAQIGYTPHGFSIGEICLGAPLSVPYDRATWSGSPEMCLITPNPVRAGDRIALSAGSDDALDVSARVTVRSLLGETMSPSIHATGSGDVIVETAGLPPGHYVVSFAIGAETRSCRLVVY